MQVVGAEARTRRLVVVADDSLIVEAMALGLRQSGQFELLGHVNAWTGKSPPVFDAVPDIVLVDEMERSDEVVTLISQIKAANPDVAVIVLTSSMEPEWLDAIFAAGAMGAISKSTHPGAIATLVGETINGHVIQIHRSREPWQSSTLSAVSRADCQLTARELEVLRLVAAGSTNGDIARKLWVTEQTVKFHLSNVYRKLGVANRTEASRYAQVNGLVGEPWAVS
jgi:DNA-binding NarL/FixJ family response regulator